jgi:hypothetical protein
MKNNYAFQSFDALNRARVSDENLVALAHSWLDQEAEGARASLAHKRFILWVVQDPTYALAFVLNVIDYSECRWQELSDSIGVGLVYSLVDMSSEDMVPMYQSAIKENKGFDFFTKMRKINLNRAPWNKL